VVSALIVFVSAKFLDLSPRFRLVSTHGDHKASLRGEKAFLLLTGASSSSFANFKIYVLLYAFT
jgi:hypothetical protein